MPKDKPYSAEFKARVVWGGRCGAPRRSTSWPQGIGVDESHRGYGELTTECGHLQRGLLERCGIDIEGVTGRPGKR